MFPAVRMPLSARFQWSGKSGTQRVANRYTPFKFRSWNVEFSFLKWAAKSLTQPAPLTQWRTNQWLLQLSRSLDARSDSLSHGTVWVVSSSNQGWPAGRLWTWRRRQTVMKSTNYESSQMQTPTSPTSTNTPSWAKFLRTSGPKWEKQCLLDTTTNQSSMNCPNASELCPTIKTRVASSSLWLRKWLSLMDKSQSWRQKISLARRPLSLFKINTKTSSSTGAKLLTPMSNTSKLTMVCQRANSQPSSSLHRTRPKWKRYTLSRRVYHNTCMLTVRSMS